MWGSTEFQVSRLFPLSNFSTSHFKKCSPFSTLINAAYPARPPESAQVGMLDREKNGSPYAAVKRLALDRELGWFINRRGTRPERTKSMNSTSGAQFAAQLLVKPVVWFARAVVNWRSRSVAKSVYYKEGPACGQNTHMRVRTHTLRAELSLLHGF